MSKPLSFIALDFVLILNTPIIINNLFLSPKIMERVAGRLKDIALAEPAPDLMALYAKTSYNRYYYHCFRITVNEVNQISPFTAKKIHQAISSNLTGPYKVKIKDKIEHASISDVEKDAYKATVEDITKKWNKIVAELMDARHAADYQEASKIELVPATGEITIVYTDDNKKTQRISISEVTSKLKELSHMLKSLDAILKTIGMR